MVVGWWRGESQVQAMKQGAGTETDGVGDWSRVGRFHKSPNNSTSSRCKMPLLPSLASACRQRAWRRRRHGRPRRVGRAMPFILLLPAERRAEEREGSRGSSCCKPRATTFACSSSLEFATGIRRVGRDLDRASPRPRWANLTIGIRMRGQCASSVPSLFDSHLSSTSLTCRPQIRRQRMI